MLHPQLPNSTTSIDTDTIVFITYPQQQIALSPRNKPYDYDFSWQAAAFSGASKSSETLRSFRSRKSARFSFLGP